MPSLSPAKLGQVLTDSRLLSFGTECSGFSPFLPILQSQAGLCVLTSCLRSLALTAIRDVHGEPALVVGGVGVQVRHAEHWRCPKASWGDLQVKYPQWLFGRLPDGVHKVARRICVLFCPPRHQLLFPQLLPAPSHLGRFSILDE